MFEKSAAARHRNAARVIVRLTGEAPFEAFVFLKVDERLIDLLNDSRQFLPIKRPDGSTLIASKRNIVSVIESDDAPPVAAPHAAPTDEMPPPHDRQDDSKGSGGPDADAAGAADAGTDRAETETDTGSDAKTGEAEARPARKKFDPYEVLRIPRTATIEEIRRAYHLRIKAVHPDSLANLGLDEDIERAAHFSAQRVNRAYNALMRERRAAKASEA